VPLFENLHIPENYVLCSIFWIYSWETGRAVVLVLLQLHPLQNTFRRKMLHAILQDFKNSPSSKNTDMPVICMKQGILSNFNL